MGFLSAIEYYRPKIEEAIKEFIEEEKGRAEWSFHRKFYEDIIEFVSRGGKRLRPISTIMAYKAVGGSEEGSIIRASISMEFLHNSSLIHDDIIDEDHVRRGGPTFHIKYRDYLRGFPRIVNPYHWGLSFGILGGDALFNLGFKALMSSPFRNGLKLKALECYVRAYERIVLGEITDLMLTALRRADEADYELLVRLKTAALFEESIAMGAILGGGTRSQLYSLRKYAVNAAKAFQIQDDILGLYGEERELGKPVGSDVREGRMTILVIKALEVAEERERDSILSALGNPSVGEDEIEYMRRLLDRLGVLEWARNRAEELIGEAVRYLGLARPPLDSESADFFKSLADFFVKRRF